LVAIPPFARAKELTDLAKRLGLLLQRPLLRETAKLEEPPEQGSLALSAP